MPSAELGRDASCSTPEPHCSCSPEPGRAVRAATLLGWHRSVFSLCTEPSPCGSSAAIVSAYASSKSRDFVNKPARGIPRKTARQDYAEIFSLSISIEIFEQENPVYTIGSSQGLLISLQRNTDVLTLVQEEGPERIQGLPSLLPLGKKG